MFYKRTTSAGSTRNSSHTPNLHSSQLQTFTDRLTRIANLKEDRCKPKKCCQECKKSCPVVKTGCEFFHLNIYPSWICSTQAHKLKKAVSKRIASISGVW
ncbi:putative RNase L inhibitor RLI, possible metal-binding domain-containing protein [Helianthus annuus]|nr:putative RNase L inhibitor RLI, possible metal-binding domain-containing protein [Helianthus annuus]